MRRRPRRLRLAAAAVAAAACALPLGHAIGQAKVRLSGLQNCSSYDREAEFFVQIQNEGLRMAPAADPPRAASRDGSPLGQRTSERVLVTHDGWPLDCNEMTRQTEPGMHTLQMQVVNFHARELEPQTLLSQEAFASASLPFCDDPARVVGSDSTACVGSAEATTLPFRDTASGLDVVAVESVVKYTVIDEQRGSTEWGLAPFDLQTGSAAGFRGGDDANRAVDDGNSDGGTEAAHDAAATLDASFYQLHTPALLPYDASAAAAASGGGGGDAVFTADPVVRVPLSVGRWWSASGDLVREHSAVAVDVWAEVAAPLSDAGVAGSSSGGGGGGSAQCSRAAGSGGGGNATMRRRWVGLRRGGGQAVVLLRGSELFQDGWQWWLDGRCSVVLALRFALHCSGTQQAPARQCTPLKYPGEARVRLVPFDGDGAAAAAAADRHHPGNGAPPQQPWERLPRALAAGTAAVFGPGPAQLLALSGPVVIDDHASVDVAAGSVVVMGAGVDIQVRGGGALRLGTGATTAAATAAGAAAAQGGASAPTHYVPTTFLCGVPPPPLPLLPLPSSSSPPPSSSPPSPSSPPPLSLPPGDAEAAAWGGIYAVGYASRVEVAAAQIVDAGQGWAGTWQTANDDAGARALGRPSSSSSLLHDNGPAHLQEKAVFDVRHGAELVAEGVALHGRRGQAVVGMASTISLARCQVHGFLGGLQLADAVVRVVRCHLSHFFDHPSPLWRPGASTTRPTDNDVVGGGLEYADHDNDAMYVTGGDLVLRSSVIVGAGDDCVDSGTGAGGRVDVAGCWIEGCQHEGVALSNNGAGPKTVSVTHTVVRGCQQGLELGFSTSLLSVDVRHTLFTANYVGLRLGDNYGWLTLGGASCTGCAFAGNGRDVVSLDRQHCDRVPLQQLVLAGCLLETRAALPVVRENERLHGMAASGNQCARLLPPADVGFNFAVAPADGAGGGDSRRPSPLGVRGDGLSPRCGNAFAAEPVRYQHSGVVRTVGAAAQARGGVGGGSSASSSSASSSSVPTSPSASSAFAASAAVAEGAPGAWGLRPAAIPAAVPSWQLVGGGGGGGGGGDAPAARAAEPAVRVRRPPRSVTMHAQSQQLAEWDVARRIQQHEREEAVGGAEDTRRTTAPAEAFAENATAAELRSVGRALQDLSWAVADVHMFVLWSSTPEVVVQEVTTYLCSAKSGVNVLGVWTVLPSGTVGVGGAQQQQQQQQRGGVEEAGEPSHRLYEEFYRRFYGDTYYSIFETGGRRVGMAEHKGAGAFTVLLVEDPAPEFGSVPGSPAKGTRVNKRVYALKHQLRRWLPRKFQLHGTQNATEAEREIQWMFGGSRAEVAAQVHRELRVLHRHHSSQLHGPSGRGGDGDGSVRRHEDAVGLQSPMCWPAAPRRPPHGVLPHHRPSHGTRTDAGAGTGGGGGDGDDGWRAWAGGWVGGRLGGTSLSGLAVLPVDHLHSSSSGAAAATADDDGVYPGAGGRGGIGDAGVEVAVAVAVGADGDSTAGQVTASSSSASSPSSFASWRGRPPQLRIVRSAPVGDVVAVMLKGEWPKLNMDVLSIERDLHRIILEPNPYNASENFQRSVLLGKISLPLALHTPMDARWGVTFAAVADLADFRVLAANAWPADAQCRSVRALWRAVKPFVGRAQEIENLQLRKIVEMVDALQRDGPRVFDWTVVALTHSARPGFAGPFTLWDGNHRAVALFGYFDLLRTQVAAAAAAAATGAGGKAVLAAVLAEAEAARETMRQHHVRLYVGRSETIWRGHKGSFYCPDEGL